VASKLAWFASKRNAIVVVAAVVSTAVGVVGGGVPTFGFWEGT